MRDWRAHIERGENDERGDIIGRDLHFFGDTGLAVQHLMGLTSIDGWHIQEAGLDVGWIVETDSDEMAEWLEAHPERASYEEGSFGVWRLKTA